MNVMHSDKVWTFSKEVKFMPWNNQGNNGPWKSPQQGPWGQGPGGGGGSPDLEEFMRKSQEALRRFAPSGGFGGSAGIAMLVLAGAVIWLASGFYTVAPNEVGINQIFGRYTGKTAPGLNYNLPYPVGAVTRLKVTDRVSIDVGSNLKDDPRNPGISTSRAMNNESLMLTGDENIADVKFRVILQIDPVRPEDFAFNVRNPLPTVKAVAESAMREVVGRKEIQKILTSERPAIEQETQTLMQRVLNDYKAGVLILQVQLMQVDPPAQVIASFRDVTAAQQDQERQANEAQSYANRVVPEARGAAARITQEAEGYREQTVAEAKGQASRFSQVYEQYKKAPDVTRERIYLETMERVLAASDKIIIDQGKGSATPYLPLDGFNPRAIKGATK